MASLTKRLFSPEEYLEMERKADYRSQYLDGEIFAMAGASEPHNLITVSVAAVLHSQMKGRSCKVYASDMRVDVRLNGLYTYPDVVAICGEIKLSDEHKDMLLNPTVIIEVLSESTEAFDRGEKFERYRRIESLVEYLLVAQDRPHIEHYVRQASGRWLLSEANGLDNSLHLNSIGCDLSLADVYEKLDLAR